MHDHDANATGLLALELADGAIGVDALATDAAMALAECLALDLARIAPRAADCDLVLAAAHFDPAEALRPGWPLHQRLAELHARAPRANTRAARIFAFGADAQGRVPLPFMAEPELRGGALRVLPFLLTGADAAAVQEQLEAELLDRGMASARTALLAQEAFAARIEHARLFTLHDLAAMMALQYEHAGLRVLWPVIEVALLAPAGSVEVDAPPEPRLRYAEGVSHLEIASPSRWQREFPGGNELTLEQTVRGYAAYEARLRQFAAVLAAHGIDAVFDYVDA
ncbi:hypothetical protein FNZ56_08845 [Pseudoluteimonas lycopersici]|uniref:Uncharacterized protein n=1 Tax=Pseudoluteimonas lycopersici TaxID=1324796 RepID=A0A516V624_9GAMM|nr:hypothetical protein [Lysobacter lycopersici]QDQ73975.1 hypothetical protein FNZ56_08845 [Lysobacter lycopersici]